MVFFLYTSEMICTVVIAGCSCGGFAGEQGLILTPWDKCYEECTEEKERDGN